MKINMSAVISDGLYVVLQWIEQRRRETNEYIRQYADNMMKSIAVIHRRIRMEMQREGFGDPSHLLIDRPDESPGAVAWYRRLLYGVPGTTRRGGWFQRPDHEYAAWLYNQWITGLLIHHETQRPYYFPGL